MTPIATGSTATDAGLPADLVARFAAALARLRPDGGRIGLAISGGPDSMAMLLLAHAAIPGEFEVATVDHGLRHAAREECALVEAVCRDRAIACAVLRVELAAGNLQAAAREARYAALAEWTGQSRLTALATAHQADDQAETLVMRLNRGCGVAGLGGVRERAHVAELDLRLIRPVLAFRRAELGQVIAAAGIPVVHDLSNEDESFERVRIRKALAGADWLDPLAWAKSAARLAEADELLDHVTAMIWSRSVSCDKDRVVFSYEGWRAIHLRIIDKAVSLLGSAPRGQDVARLLDRLEDGQGGNIGGVLARVEYIPGERLRWVFRPEPRRGSG